MRVSMLRNIKFAPSVKEFRLHLCQSSAESKGARDFVEKFYVNMKRENPQLPILIRECSGVQPRLWTRFEQGKEKSVPLTNVSADEILKLVESTK
ncbi:CLUMA_CG010828, isoform A [Clunio marinus]|uniref:NADH dehydrogenase [ubiquinone] 1 alpha subcomplex subunit 2 n=1 Tax=Clunio marinus TaxID=568069 RepID=A0A1J1IAX8_9DIPT|nr:CLUMA_CG010828, isoform A [Clunio marinus]